LAVQAEFRLLGPLHVRSDQVLFGVAAARQRVVLAALAVRAGQVVSSEELARAIWDDAPPAKARVTVRNYVCRLRQALGPVGGRIVTCAPGYLLEANDDEVDLLAFTRLCGAGSVAARAGAWQRASDVLDDALGLWRGIPLADVPSAVLRDKHVPALESQLLQATEWRLEAGLHLGRHSQLVPELQALAREQPLRERFRAQLMLALYRGGRQAEALGAYQGIRRALVDDLGVEPGPELQELHRRILAADPELLPGDASVGAGPPAASEERTVRAAGPERVAPHQLPAGPRLFAGREGELSALTGLLAEVGGPRGAVVISAIAGTAGVGKTALAVHWAHQVADRFPDGQLYVNLRGYDPGQPMPATDALAGFLRALGMPGQDIPPEAEERAARYRSLLAGRRMLVVLDNAGEVGQVRLLLPGTQASVTVVTSRDALAGLVARDGAQRLDLDLLPLAEAVGLLRALIGARVDADPAAAAVLAAQCSRLPLALRVAAELAAARPAAGLAELAGELADQQRRLDLLDAGGDPQTAVRAVFSWSYRHLDAAAARAFWLLSLHPGADLDRYAAAALTGTTRERACQLLDRLSRAHLIQPTRPGRHAMHDLLRAYGQELSADGDGKDERRGALTRLFDYYLHTAAAAMNTLFPVESGDRPSIPLPAALALPATEHPAAARAWLDRELANLVAVAIHSAADGWPGHTTRLAATLFRYLDSGGHISEAVTVHSHARSAATQISDRAAEAEALTSLGVANLRQGRFQQATGHLKQALRLCQQIGDRGGEARVLIDLGLVDLRQSRYEQGRDGLQLAVAVYREIGDQSGEARALANLGIIERRLGRYQRASECLRRALAVCRATGDRLSQAPVLTNLGLVDLQLGRCQKAVGHHRQALTLFRETGNHNGEAHALSNLGVAELRCERYQQAAGHLRQALTLFRKTSDRAGEAEALNGLGEALLAAGQPGRARTQHAAALVLTSQTGDKHEQARAHNGLGHCCHVTGDPGQDLRHWQEALALFADLGAPEADHVRAQLAAGNDCRQTLEPPSSGAAKLANRCQGTGDPGFLSPRLASGM
jgi:DNA-binding SARP family transcriptional activator/Tfp pilus assembly protein PilF